MRGAKQILSLLVVIIMVWASLSFAGVVNLPQTGQTTCYDESGTVIDCAGTGQDGEYQKGIAWPIPRFTDNGDGTVTDNLTGLMWLKDADCLGKTNWQGNLDAVADLNANPGNYGCIDYTGNYSDWRLPNIVEFAGLFNAEEGNPSVWLEGQGFSNVLPQMYFSSTTHAEYTILANALRISTGATGGGSGKEYYSNTPVFPVRTEQAGLAQTWQTGQTNCYDLYGTIIDCSGTGQDGDIISGVPWPSPRLENNGDGTITDHLTGLIWLKDHYCPGRMSWNDALAFCNNLAHGSCGLTDGSVAGDWRLPNRKELMSLVDYSKYNPALPDNPYVFTIGGTQYSRWSSTTKAVAPASAYILAIWDGLIYGRIKSGRARLMAVKGGTTCGNTLSGSYVTVQSEDCSGGAVGGTPVSLTFDQVDACGNTTLCTSSQGPSPPSGFSIACRGRIYYEINTTAIYSGNIEVCIDYGDDCPNENNLTLFQKKEGQQDWQKLTSTVDTTNNRICATVDSFSVFAIFAPVDDDGPAVGGIVEPIDKVQLLVPWMSLATLILLTIGIVVLRRVRK